MSCLTLVTSTQRLATTALIGLTFLLQGCVTICSDPDPSKTCQTFVAREGIYVVRYRQYSDLLSEQTTTRASVAGGVLVICDCAKILEARFIQTVPIDLSIAVSDLPDPVTVNQTLAYTITVTNHGSEDATDINLEVTLPVSINILDASPLTCAPANGNITCTNPLPFDLASGDTATFTLRVAPTATGQVTMTASAYEIQVDSNPNNNVVTELTTVNPASGGADAAVSIAAVPNPVTRNNELRFTIVVQNLDSQTAAPGVTMTGFDVRPIGELLGTETTQGSCSIANGILTCNMGTLAGGASATVTIRAIPFDAGTYTETVTITSTNDSNSANNSASVEVRVNPP